MNNEHAYLRQLTKVQSTRRYRDEEEEDRPSWIQRNPMLAGLLGVGGAMALGYGGHKLYKHLREQRDIADYPEPVDNDYTDPLTASIDQTADREYARNMTQFKNSPDVKMDVSDGAMFGPGSVARQHQTAAAQARTPRLDQQARIYGTQFGIPVPSNSGIENVAPTSSPDALRALAIGADIAND